MHFDPSASSTTSAAAGPSDAAIPLPTLPPLQAIPSSSSMSAAPVAPAAGHAAHTLAHHQVHSVHHHPQHGGQPAAALPLHPAVPAPQYEESFYEKGEPVEEPLTFGEWAHEVFRENQTLINTFCAGGLAGATSRTAVAPLERLKIILQVQSSQPGGSGQAYGGIWPSLARMWKAEGFAGFMKGNGINVVRILPYSALQFSSYGVFKGMLRRWSGEESLSAPLRLSAGAGAGIVAVVATYPLDLVRARLSIATANMAQTNGGVSAFTSADAKLGIVGMTKKVYNTEGGLRGLYRGVGATAVGVAPYVSLNFYMYESLKNLILPDGVELGDAEFAARKLGCGGLAGAISLIFTHPMDVVRRKMQVAGLGGLSPRYTGAIDCIRQTIKTDGFWKGMYRGLVPNFVKIVPSMAVSFYTFDTTVDLLQRWEAEDDDFDDEEMA